MITFFKDAFDLLLDTLDDNEASVKEWCFSTSNGTTGWVQGIIDSNSNACYTTSLHTLFSGRGKAKTGQTYKVYFHYFHYKNKNDEVFMSHFVVIH